MEFNHILSAQILKEVQLSHSVGPFLFPPLPHFVSSSLAVREKKNGGYRIIMDLSRPFDSSVNDFIDRDEYSLSFCSVDDAVYNLINLGKNAFMTKLDIKHAFRLIPVRKQDWHLLGYKFDGRYFFDIVLPFGLRSAPYLFCLISDAVEWIFKNVTGHCHILHYVDDFLIMCEPSAPLADKLYSDFTSVCEDLGVPLALEKTEGPSNRLTFLGIELDSAEQALSLPCGKLTEIQKILSGFKKKNSAQKKSCKV